MRPIVVALGLDARYSLGMANTLPPIEFITDKLHAMTTRQLQLLALLSEVPEHTLLKIRSGKTTNPRYETVWKIYPLIRRAVRDVQ